MNNIEFANKCKEVATKYKTLYVMGCFGAPMNDTNKKRYCNNHSYNKRAERTKMIQAASADTFGFDCVCMIKGILWGWNGDASRVYGGASYAVNGVPDIDADAMIEVCKGISTDFSKIEIGEAVWMEGHIGVYIGDGLAVECTPKWSNCVQITACNCSKSGYNRRNWTKHGKLPYVDYVEKSVESEKPETKPEENGVEQKMYVKIDVADKAQAEKLVKLLKNAEIVEVKSEPAPAPAPEVKPDTLNLGDTVKLVSGATYYNGKGIPSWVFDSTLYVRDISGDRVVISTLKTGAVTGAVHRKHLKKI